MPLVNGQLADKYGKDMMITEERIYYLLRTYTAGTATPAEEQELFQWLEETDDITIFKDHIYQIVQHTEDDAYSQVDWDLMYRRILTKSRLKKGNKGKGGGRRLIPWRWAAAVVLIIAVMGIGSYLFFQKRQALYATITPASDRNEIHLAGPKAVLKAGRVQVTLNTKDTSFRLGGNVVHLSGGQLNITKRKAEQYTLIIPRGGTYKVALADGTTIWLNADSKLIYPSVFTGSEREVTLEGEAYFEVADDPFRPFVVHAAGQQVHVLGTRFNIQAYGDEEDVVTTLVDGRVAVHVPGDSVLLKQKQQTRWDRVGRLHLETDVDVALAIAWKNGYFRFYKTDIKTIMRELARWYDVTINYAPGLKPMYFGGLIRRKDDISEVLKMLEATNDIHFQMEGKKITVLP